MIKTCCTKMEENKKAYNGTFEVGIEQEINVPGCCGGGCYIISDLIYCPWCGKKLELT